MGERADAARNRAAILDAAESLFQRADLDHVSLERIAQVAGVGKATVLRRFGDLLGLVDALIAPRVAALQDRVRSGEPPLGPGGDPVARLHAYLDALLDFVLDSRTLIRALEHYGPYAYYANPASQFWIGELTDRIRAARPTVDAGYLAHAVFTALRADVVDYLQQHRHMDAERIRAGVHSLADPRLTDPPARPDERNPA
ncbi:TetR/AcrR family transcriptional regulator [Micromonospora sp. AMSO31t]|uniref:TetR/AcrR family transcriptional regulator n=1 Tax=Micromonospora sp. AMSO31t TaxID=2650566 RepID=UPI00124B93C7|nr:TetR/AcrR family transcriptional regulator [Micromonospora sp. AMSO31t]KAB1916412.1 helix-turn-helix transcriptional regulator [Micromonospora sp. AMSO31t]